MDTVFDRLAGLTRLSAVAFLCCGLASACDDSDKGSAGDAGGALDAAGSADAGADDGGVIDPIAPGVDAAGEEAGPPVNPDRPVTPPVDLPAPTKPATPAGVIVAVSHDLMISVSTDSGATWNNVSHMPGTPEVQGLLIRSSFANGRYFATGWRFFSSADAVTFTEATLPVKQWFGDVVFGSGIYLTAGGYGSYMTSVDGIKWVSGKLAAVNSPVLSVAAGDGRFAMALGDGSVYVSSDAAKTWAVDPTLKTTSVAFCQGAFKEGSACGKPDPGNSLWQGHGYWYFARWTDRTLLRSSDGKNFAPIHVFPANVRDLAFSDEL